MQIVYSPSFSISEQSWMTGWGDLSVLTAWSWMLKEARGASCAHLSWGIAALFLNTFCKGIVFGGECYCWPMLRCFLWLLYENGNKALYLSPRSWLY